MIRSAEPLHISLDVTLVQCLSLILDIPSIPKKTIVQELKPLVFQVERRLTSTLSMISHGANLSLLKLVTTFLTIFALSTLKFSPKILDLLNKICGWCLWTKKSDEGEKYNSLGAWNMVCSPKDSGWLGTINLSIQSDALFLKYLHKCYNRFYPPGGTPFVYHTMLWKFHMHEITAALFGGDIY